MFWRNLDAPYGDKYIAYDGVTNNVLITYAPNTWYNTKIWLKPGTKTQDIWINNVKVVTNINWANAGATGIDNFYWEVYGPDAQYSWIDNIRIRKYASPEPAVSGGGAETACYTGTLVTTTNWTGLIAVGQKVAMGQPIAQISFQMAVSGTGTAHWKRFRVDKYCRAGQALIPDDKIVVQLWMENNNDGFFDAGDQMIAQGTFTNNTCYLNMNRWAVTTAFKTYYIVYKFDANCGGGQFAGVNIGASSWLEFEDAIAVGVPP